MSPIVSELLKFTVGPGFRLGSASFVNPRRAVVAIEGAILWDEHEHVKHPVVDNPCNKSALESPEFRNAVKALDVNETPQSWYLPFAHDSLPRPALTAPICELCFLHVDKTADRRSLDHSLNKAFTDCYYADGLTGGHWSTATNDDDMNYYYLGWESRAHHAAYSKPDLFALEVDKLMPHMDGGGANLVKLTQELS